MDQEPIQAPPAPASVEPTSPQPASSPRGFHPFLVFVGIILFVLVGAGGLFLGKSLNNPQSSAQPTIVRLPTSTPDPTTNWKKYSNFRFN